MQTLSQKITEQLREQILSGALKPGQHLEEIPLASQLGVSRTPLRGALNALAHQGLLTYQAKRGYLIRRFDIRDIVAAYAVRANLEGMACRMAAEQGLSDELIALLHEQLAAGDAMLGKGYLAAEDFEPYRQMNVMLHEVLIDNSANHWIGEFVQRTQEIPYVSSRLMLWHDYATILRSHDDHHRIVDAVIRREGWRAEALMREHVYFAGRFLEANFARVSGD
ncbi:MULTISPECIES: GntR family transcriptional regulator [unclassified Pseudomonas]|uniref:GntR family transcriptional regulator n=1 Tax=unclassified Pseudomonas TaxID=196821 RepID=UPI0025E4C8C8|nr:MULTISPECIES: GntR family transcriptional regulator [unclassified Pseudomonas]